MKWVIAIITTLACLGAVGISNRAEAQSILGAGIYNTTNSPVFSYSGTWVTSSTSEYFMGDVQRTTELNGSVSFYIFGDSVVIYGARTTTGSNNVLLCVDSVCSAISFYSPSIFFGVIAEIAGLNYGTHEIELINQQAGANIFFDAVFIEDYQIEPTIQVVVTAQFSLPEQTPEPLPEWQSTAVINGETVLFSREQTTGDRSSFLLLMVIAFLTLVSLVIQIWGR